MTGAGNANDAVPILLTIGGIFLIGLFADLLGRRTPLPRVTLLLLAGLLVGPELLDLLPAFTEQWFPILTNLALAMIGFLIGQTIRPENLRRLGRRVLILSTSKVILASACVFGGLLLLGVELEAALLLAGIAPATAPAATFDVVHEIEAEGEFTDTLLGIVAIDDGWGIILFSLLLSIAERLTGDSGSLGVLGSASWELFGALALGAFVSSFAAHHRRPFQAIEGIEWPYLILFFLLAPRRPLR